MNTTPNPSHEPMAAPNPEPREGTWARPVDRLRVSGLPEGVINLNVEGRHITGPLQGFGQLWQKTYRLRLSGADVTPKQVIQVWKDNFGKFWPKGNYFYSALGKIAPGEVAVLNVAGPFGITAPGGRPVISTGIMVIYADEESFSFMTPDGHMFAGMNTFSAYEEDGRTAVQIQVLVRANDPLYEFGCRLGIVHKTEDDFWKQTLINLAAQFDVDGYVQQTNTLVDPKVQWSEAKNIWQNAAIRTGLYMVGAPLRWVRGVFNKK